VSANSDNASLAKKLRAERLRHHYCEDCWYSCPKAEDGCCNPDKGTECTCGADKTNAVIDAAADALDLAEVLRDENYNCAPIADTLNTWCREAHVEETPSSKWPDVRATVYRLWDKLGSSRPATQQRLDREAQDFGEGSTCA
jgi:hypothetical protein